MGEYAHTDTHIKKMLPILKAAPILLQVSDDVVECVSHDIQVLDQQHISAFLDIVLDLGSKSKTGASLEL